MVTRNRTLTVSDDVVIAATPDELYAVLSDPSRMKDWSPENTAATSPGPLTLGMEFDGTNRRGRKRWVTRSRVTAADPGRKLAWTVTKIGLRTPVVRSANATWAYTFEVAPDGAGTRVTETWTDDRMWPDRFAKVFDRWATGSSFPEYQRGNIRRTLDRLKADVEGARTAGR